MNDFPGYVPLKPLSEYRMGVSIASRVASVSNSKSISSAVRRSGTSRNRNRAPARSGSEVGSYSSRSVTSPRTYPNSDGCSNPSDGASRISSVPFRRAGSSAVLLATGLTGVSAIEEGPKEKGYRFSWARWGL